MFYILLFVCVVLFVAVVMLSVVLFELMKGRPGRIVRKWRFAFSKRRQINRALATANKARDQMLRANRDRDTAVDGIARMGSYIIAEQCGDHIKGIRANNYHAKEKKILKSIDTAEKYGYSLPDDERRQLARMLEQAHEKAMRLEAEREEQARIKAQIREEERARKEAERAIKQAEKEAKLKEQALNEAIRMLGDTHSEAIDQLKQELADAQAALVRTKSMAEQTRSGHIYIISNIGSFGENVFKVGMTRRLEPELRVRELGDASVPFGFDVHAMISCDDAPALEAALHRALHDCRVNKVNFRKEFFRVDLDTIIKHVEANHGRVEYVVDSEALEYFETVAIESDTESVDDKLGV